MTYSSVLEWLRTSGTVDVVGVAGFMLTLGGFGLTLWKVSQSKAAAEDAKTAANEARAEVFRIESFIDLTAAITALEAIKTLHREGAWTILADRYSGARKLLIGVRSRTANLSPEQSAVISNCIATFSSLELQLDKSKNDYSKINIGTANSKLSSDIDSLVALLHSARS